MAKKLLRNVADIWASLKKVILNNPLSDHGGNLDPDQYCISPSDFGFHNALRMPNGKIKFLDFEYAGWDDPAKMADDFFSQIAVPVPEQFFDRFVSEITLIFPNSDKLIARTGLLRPLYRIKWFCIVLNVFLPDHLERCQFAQDNMDVDMLKSIQLIKAQKILEKLNA